MPRASSLNNLRTDILQTLGPAIQAMNTDVHAKVRETVRQINQEYISSRKAALGRSQQNTYTTGLYLSYESTIEKHTGLEIGYIRWRHGRYSVNKPRRHANKTPLTSRVGKVSRAQLHYSVADFERVPRWRVAPPWERRLVLYTERKVRPLREALQAHKEAQRTFLHAPTIPDIDVSFDDFLP